MIKRLLALFSVVIILSSCSFKEPCLSEAGVSRIEILSMESNDAPLHLKTIALSDKSPIFTLETDEVNLDNCILEEEIELIALLTMAEAEGECENGQRLVIDTILNRVDSEYFPNSVREVIYQPNQFTPMWNGRIERCEVRADICQLVREELTSRFDHDVVFFNAGHYSEYGTPLFQVGHHYFSAYKEAEL